MVGFVVPLQGVVLLPEAAGGAEDVSLNVDILAGYAASAGYPARSSPANAA